MRWKSSNSMLLKQWHGILHVRCEDSCIAVRKSTKMELQLRVNDSGQIPSFHLMEAVKHSSLKSHSTASLAYVFDCVSCLVCKTQGLLYFCIKQSCFKPEVNSLQDGD